MCKTTCFIFFLLLSFLTPVEEGVLDLWVTDVTGQTVRNIGNTCGERCATAYTDDAGRARLKLPPEAEAAWKRALAILEKVVEPDHYRLLKPLNGYWLTLLEMGRGAEAKTVRERIQAILRKYPDCGVKLS